MRSLKLTSLLISGQETPYQTWARHYAFPGHARALYDTALVDLGDVVHDVVLAHGGRRVSAVVVGLLPGAP